MDKAILSVANGMQGYGVAIYALITMLIAAILTMIIGLERELKGEPAGLQTHMLLSVGCSLLMTLSIWAIRSADGSIDIVEGTLNPTLDLNYDTSRIAAADVTGVGFLGAGAIIKYGLSVKGLSTAATIWISAAIGLACGAGFVLEAIVLTMVTMSILLVISAAKNLIKKTLPLVQVKVPHGAAIISHINEYADRNRMVIREIGSTDVPDAICIDVYFAYSTQRVMLQDLANYMKINEDVLDVTVSTNRLK